jgi:O-antigen ligase
VWYRGDVHTDVQQIKPLAQALLTLQTVLGGSLLAMWRALRRRLLVVLRVVLAGSYDRHLSIPLVLLFLDD